MKLNATERALVGGGVAAIAIIGGLALLRSRSTHGTDTTEPTGTTANAKVPTVAVGFLPVTCHLTCPVTDFATRTSTTHRFVSQRFTDFPTVADAVKSRRLLATFMIAPLAMKLREQGVPVKIVYLGHRDGSTLIVRRGDPAKSLRDLKGKTFAIPSKFSNQNLVVRELMAKQGMAPNDINFVEMPPPEMPVALAAKQIDAYFVGEPFAAKAEMDGTGRVLYFAKDIAPHFISCVLVVHEDLINKNPDAVRDLVRGIAQSGAWAQTHRAEAAKVAAPYYHQKEALIRFALTKPPGRVSYSMLTPTDSDLQHIGDTAYKLGILKKPIDVKQLVDREFIPATIKPATIKLTSAVQ